MQYELGVQRKQVMEAAASLSLSSGGTLPRMHRKGHRRTSSSSSIGEDIVGSRDSLSATSSCNVAPAPVPTTRVVQSRGDQLIIDSDTPSSRSSPSIRSQSDDVPFYNRLRSNKKPASKHDSLPAEMRDHVPVTTGAAKGLERSQVR